MHPTFIWMFGHFYENYVNDSCFSKNNETINESVNTHEIVERKNLDKINKPSTMVLKRKRVYYFTPKYFSNDTSYLIQKIHHFYTKRFKENSNFNIDPECYLINKSFEKPPFQAEQPNVDQNISYPILECESVSNSFISENYNNTDNIEKDYFGIHVLSHALDILRQYLIFPFAITELVSNSVKATENGPIHNSCDSCVKDNSTTQQVDIYSLDDESFEDFCLMEEETKLQRSPRSFLIKETESEILKHNEKDNLNGYDDQYLTPLDKNLNKNTEFSDFSEKLSFEPVMNEKKCELKKFWKMHSHKKQFQEFIVSENSELSFSKLISMLFKIHEIPVKKEIK
ncbi:hypothetical protein NPIL_602031 [Nephila pilipes]|uniref:Uncharacterized protein n=1 Tax=Nephila pilipes TaxID=299642 RepID=A0A8X6TIK2_NEPPI|nr:hypothetical protein NPIL_602031 [Nephila pilipes]